MGWIICCKTSLYGNYLLILFHQSLCMAKNEYEFEAEERRKEKKSRGFYLGKKSAEKTDDCHFFAGFKMYVHCVRER